jgi:hypothetical protein
MRTRGRQGVDRAFEAGRMCGSSLPPGPRAPCRSRSRRRRSAPWRPFKPGPSRFEPRKPHLPAPRPFTRRLRGTNVKMFPLPHSGPERERRSPAVLERRSTYPNSSTTKCPERTDVRRSVGRRVCMCRSSDATSCSDVFCDSFERLGDSAVRWCLAARCARARPANAAAKGSFKYTSS